MGGGGSSKTGSAQKWAKPFAKAAAAETTGVYNAAKPGLEALTEGVQGAVPGIYEKYQQGNPALKAATGYDVNLMGRDPYAGSSQLENLIASSRGHALDAVNANFGSRGSFGGTAHTTAAMKAAMDAEAGLRYGDAQNIMQMQQAASANAPQKAAADYLGIQPFLQAAQVGAELPYTGINAQNSGLAQLFQGGKTTGPSPLGQALGVGAQAAASYFGGAKFA